MFVSIFSFFCFFVCNKDKLGKGIFFYPSVSGSWLINETFRESMPSWINLAKLRASWAQVGNDTDPYTVNQTYSFATMEMYDGNIYTTLIPQHYYKIFFLST